MEIVATIASATSVVIKIKNLFKSRARGAAC